MPFHNFQNSKHLKDTIERYRENQGKFNDLVSHCQNLVKKPTWDLEIFNEFREKFTKLESEFNFGEVLLEEKIKNQSDYEQLMNVELSLALNQVVHSLRSQINKIPPCETLTKTWELLYLFFDHQSKKEFKDIEKNKYYKNKRFSKDDIYNDF